MAIPIGIISAGAFYYRFLLSHVAFTDTTHAPWGNFKGVLVKKDVSQIYTHWHIINIRGETDFFQFFLPNAQLRYRSWRNNFIQNEVLAGEKLSIRFWFNFYLLSDDGSFWIGSQEKRKHS